MAQTASDAEGFFESKAFKDQRAYLEAQASREVGVLERLNSVIQGLNTLIKKGG